MEVIRFTQKLSIKEESDSKHAHVKDKQISKRKEASERKNEKQQNTDAATTSDRAEDHSEWYPLCHARMPICTPPRYIVNKQAVVCSNTKKRTPLKMLKRGFIGYALYTDTNKQTTFKLEEIMAYTFWEQTFDNSVHWIHHKDGDHKNCVWDNLIVCDLPTLQQLEIKRLEKSSPGTKYTVIRNIHDTLTFERYLVSDAGKVYSLINHRHLFKKEIVAREYRDLGIKSDTSAVQTATKQYTTRVHNIVLQSFEGPRPEGFYIDHRNGDKLDNSLKNLEFVTQIDNIRRAFLSEQKEAREMRKKQGLIPKKKWTVGPLPSITEETRWKTVDFLPWKGLSFTRYEVSDAGHVRKLKGHKSVTLSCTQHGYIIVDLVSDEEEVEDGTLARKKKQRHCLRVSRLVAYAFVDGYSEVQNIAMHLNKNRQDNRAENLKWVSNTCVTLNGRARRVVATLVDDSDLRKEFPSITQAKKMLRVNLKSSKHGEAIQKEVDWDGSKRMAIIRVF